MELLYGVSSPFSRKCRIVGREMGLYQQSMLSEKAVMHVKSPPELVAANPIVQVPALILNDKCSVIGSDVIASYFIELVGDYAIYGGKGVLAARRLEAFADGAAEMGTRIAAELRRPQELQSVSVIERASANIKRALEFIENEFSISADDYNYGIIALGCALGYLNSRVPQYVAQANIPKITALSAKLEARKFFLETAPQ